MKLQIKKCATCGALGVGPRAVKLHPLDGLLYCERGDAETPGCYRQALDWHENRSTMVLAMMFENAAVESIERKMRKAVNIKSTKPGWLGFIDEQAWLAGWGLEHDDKKIFVYYFARAVWAWALKEQA